MPPVIIADASCLILLEKIGALPLLQKLFGRVLITETVADEFGIPLPQWISTRQPQNARQLQLLELSLDPGEASAIALALEYPALCSLAMSRLVVKRRNNCA